MSSHARRQRANALKPQICRHAPEVRRTIVSERRWWTAQPADREDDWVPRWIPRGALPSEALEDRALRARYEALQRRFKDLSRGEEPLYASLLHLARAHRHWIRPLESWDPRGARRRTPTRLLHALIEHLLVVYTPPKILYGAFDGRCQVERGGEPAWIQRWRAGSSPGRLLSPWVWVFIRVARGGSLFDALQNDLDLPLTRRDCLRFAASTASTPTWAYREAQLRGWGAPERVIKAACGSFLGRGFQADEPLTAEILGGIARLPSGALPFVQIAPALDYLKHLGSEARRAGRRLSMKGRTAETLLRGMRAWHEGLEEARWGLSGLILPPDGLTPKHWVVEAAEAPQIWAMQPLRREKEVIREGRAMHHCVASYLEQARQGGCSLWSLREGGQRRLTIEARVSARQIVQARGPCNRPPTRQERGWLERWAAENGLKIVEGV